MLKDACEQVHLEYSNTRLETPASVVEVKTVFEP